MTGLEDFGGVDVRFTLSFGKTGELVQSFTVKDEAGYMKKLKTYTVNELYASFAELGLSKEQSEQAMKDQYGLSVNEYVETLLENYDIDSAFEQYTYKEVYYVDGSDIYTALNWKATFEKSAYSLTDGKLRIEGLSLEDGGAELIWKKK